MRRLTVPALAGVLLALAACDAAELSREAPDPAPAGNAAAAQSASEPSEPETPSSVMSAELRSVTIDVMGMG